jgi:hypothetical protein
MHTNSEGRKEKTPEMSSLRGITMPRLRLDFAVFQTLSLFPMATVKYNQWVFHI